MVKVGLFLRPNAQTIDDLNNKIVIEHVVFLTTKDNFNTFIKHLDDLKISHAPREDIGIAKSVFFNDADGNILEVTYYYDADPPAS